uniref:Uncharacterized protein n=1 Tax=Glossina brevipalpis TaxID=37001 RepID=A0A1A9VZF6_9MUSC
LLHAFISSHCHDYNVLGIEIEYYDNRESGSILTLCSPKAYYAAFHLGLMRQMPESLRDLLMDDKIMKVDVDIIMHVRGLLRSHDIWVPGMLDLRYMALITRRERQDLDKVAHSVLNMKFKNDQSPLPSSERKNRILPGEKIELAPTSYATVEIFKRLAFELSPRDSYTFPNGDLNDPIFRVNFERLLDLDFDKPKESRIWYSSILLPGQVYCPSNKCLLLAPDDEYVCSVDKSKGEWYLKEQLGVKIRSENFTVRLKHFPVIRAVGYYQRTNETQCHICEQKDAFFHKTVVPMEYCVHFPAKYQIFTSPDRIFLCLKCARFSNISDLKIYNKLTKMCDAPYSYEQITDKEIFQLLAHNCARSVMLPIVMSK